MAETAIAPAQESPPVDPKDLVAVPRDFLVTLGRQLGTDRVLFEGSAARTETLAKVGDTVVRISSETKECPILFNWLRNTLFREPAHITINVAPATLGDLLDAQRELEKNGSGEERLMIEKWIGEIRRQEEPKPQGPLQIEILNADKIGAVTKIVSIKRDSEGKMAGAKLEPVP